MVLKNYRFNWLFCLNCVTWMFSMYWHDGALLYGVKVLNSQSVSLLYSDCEGTLSDLYILQKGPDAYVTLFTLLCNSGVHELHLDISWILICVNVNRTLSECELSCPLSFGVWFCCETQREVEQPPGVPSPVSPDWIPPKSSSCDLHVGNPSSDPRDCTQGEPR